MLALAAWALAACGSGGGGGGSGDAQTLLKQTFTGTHKIDSGKANVQLAVDVQGGSASGLSGPIKLGVTGPFQSVGGGAIPKFDLALNIGVQGQTFAAGLTSTSDQLYVDFGGSAYQVPANVVAQIHKSFQQSGQGSASAGKLNLAGIGLDPMSWLSGATVSGKETVGGVETDHITAKLNTGALLDDVDKLLAKVSSQKLAPSSAGTIPSKIPAGARKQIEDAVKSATVDVWSGTADHTLRKLALALDVAPTSGSVKHASVAFSIELSDLNKPQTISPPANPKPLSDLLGQLQGLLGGALPGLGGGTQSQSQSGTTSSSAPGSAQIQKYTQCLQNAKGDVAKAQACAALLTK